MTTLLRAADQLRDLLSEMRASGLLESPWGRREIEEIMDFYVPWLVSEPAEGKEEAIPCSGCASFVEIDIAYCSACYHRLEDEVGDEELRADDAEGELQRLRKDIPLPDSIFAGVAA